MKAMIVLLVASVCISSSCSKAVLNANNLEGTWILKQKSGGFSGQTTKPDKKTTLTFELPGKYATTFDNQPADKGTYIITNASRQNYYNSNVLLKLFSTNNDTLVYGLRIAHDSLFLDEGCCDRFVYTYTLQQ